MIDDNVLKKKTILKYEEQISALKKRLKKMKTNKGRLQDGQKICSNCNKDYFENQNFSWKCRIHKSDYSDEM